MNSKISAAVFLFLLSSMDFSCREDFSPKTEFKEKYVIYCYLDLDYDRYLYTGIYATVSKFYDVDGYDPSKNNTDYAVSDAVIYINYGDKLYTLREDTSSTEFTRYGTKKIYYSYFPIENMYPNNFVYLSARMPDGKSLNAQTQILEGAQLNYSYKFLKTFTTKIDRFYYGDIFTITWGEIENRLFFPRMYITYVKSGEPGILTKDIPFTYENNRPVYPSYTTAKSFSFDYSAIDSAMAGISGNDPNKQNYTAGYINFEMIEMDAALSKYYSSIHGALDNYSVKLDESIYTNINGGFGVFGSQRLLSNRWLIDSAYAYSFGYKSFTYTQAESNIK